MQYVQRSICTIARIRHQEILSRPNSDCHCKVCTQLRTCGTEAVPERSGETAEIQTGSTEE